RSRFPNGIAGHRTVGPHRAGGGPVQPRREVAGRRTRRDLRPRRRWVATGGLPHGPRHRREPAGATLGATRSNDLRTVLHAALAERGDGPREDSGTSAGPGLPGSGEEITSDRRRRRPSGRSTAWVRHEG